MASEITAPVPAVEEIILPSRICGVYLVAYKIRCCSGFADEVYIGQSIDVVTRFRTHIPAFRRIPRISSAPLRMLLLWRLPENMDSKQRIQVEDHFIIAGQLMRVGIKVKNGPSGQFPEIRNADLTEEKSILREAYRFLDMELIEFD